MSWIKNFVNNFLLLIIGCVIGFVILELFFRTYTPFEIRVKANRIVLPINKKYITKNYKSKKLDNIVIHTKNSLGFRGKEPPKEFNSYLTIVTVGGSTTECSVLSDGKTWTDILGKKLENVFERLWINNAGLDGHSTFGHIVLMKDYIIKLKPKVVLFLVGINDEGQEDYREYDKSNIKAGLYFGNLKGFLKSIATYSDVFAFLLNIYRYFKAKSRGLVYQEIDLKKMERIDISDETRIRFKKAQTKYLKSYKTRLSELIRISKKNGIEPIFITQPTLFGNAIDPVTKVNLANIKTGKNADGRLTWKLLEIYNDVTRDVGKEKNILVVDLAKELPKNSKYYYDAFHYTNEGAKKVAGIVFKDILFFLKKKWSQKN